MDLVARITALAQRIATEFNTLRASLVSSDTITGAGRWYQYVDQRWVTDSDDNYGPGYYQFAESCGSGADPTLEWEHKGILIPAGKTITQFMINMRANNAELADWEIGVYLRYPNPATRWATGLDNDAEDVDIEVWRGTWQASIAGYAGTGNDTHMLSVDLDQAVDQDSYLSICVRPTSILTDTRYLQSTYTYQLK